MTLTSEFEESLRYLDALYHKPVLPARQVGLARIEYLLDCLGNPEHAFRSVHVAGSTGKGSTTTMIGDILRAAGYATGYYRKPHLESITERITFGAEDITRDAWVRHWRRILPFVEEMLAGKADGYHLGRPTYFEVVYAMAMSHLAGTGAEWAVVETGIGGRLDATNTLRPDVAVVTNISLEHTQFLGKTEVEIAAEKAAIIKAGSDAVTAASGEALGVIRARAGQVGASLAVIPGDVRARVLQRSISGQQLLLESGQRALEVYLRLAGDFQVSNGATAYAAILALRDRGVTISDDAIRQAFADIRVPGRFEVMSQEPLVILDGAHNAAAAMELSRSLQTLISDRRVVLLFAAMADKDFEAMAAALAPAVQDVIVTHAPDSERTASPEVVAGAFENLVPSVQVVPEPDEALAVARSRARGSDVVVVSGSMYLVGHVRGTLLATGTGV